MKKMTKVPQFIYGIHPVTEALKHNPWRIKTIFLDEQKIEKNTFQAIFQSIAKNHIAYQRVDGEFFKRNYDNFLHQGIVAEVVPLQPKNKADLIRLIESKNQISLVLIPELNDGHNLGAMLRTAKALFVDGVILNPNRTPPLNHTVAKVSSGLIESVNLFAIPNFPQLMDELKKLNVWIYGLDNLGVDITDFFSKSKQSNPLQAKNALVIGDEGFGLGQLIQSKCDEILRITIDREVESLNASVSLAIALYELSTANRD